jgi:hypothetical protein
MLKLWPQSWLGIVLSDLFLFGGLVALFRPMATTLAGAFVCTVAIFGTAAGVQRNSRYWI